MDEQNKDSQISRLTAENEQLVAKLEQLQKRNRELSAQAYMAKQYVEETHGKLVQIHMNAHARVAANQQQREGACPGQFFALSKDPKWDIS